MAQTNSPFSVDPALLQAPVPPDSNWTSLLVRLLQQILAFLATLVGKQQHNPPFFISVLDYGADPTGTQDSTTAIQNAANVMPDILYFPPGKYIVSSAITLSKAGTILGSGKWSSFIQTNSATADIFDNTYGGLTISDLTLDAVVTRTGGYYINISTALTNPTGFTCRDCIFRNYFNAININGPTAGSVYLQDIRIRDCLFITGTNGTGITLGGGPSTDIGIYDCTWLTEGSQTTQIGVEITVAGNCIMTHCQMEGIGTGIQCQAALAGTSAVTQITIEGCVIDNCTGGIVLQSSSSGLLSTVVITDTWCVGDRSGGLPALVIQANGTSTINGVQVVNCQFMLGAGTNDAINIFCAAGAIVQGVLVSNNRIEQNGGSGIVMSGSGITDTNISHNRIISNSAYGMVIGSGVTGFNIVGNRIGSNGVYGISFGGSNNNVIIVGNNFLNNVSGELQGAPATSSTVVIANNI